MLESASENRFKKRAWPSYEHAAFQGNLCYFLKHNFLNKNCKDRKIDWWIVPEVSVSYSGDVFFVHDLAGWIKENHLEKPSGKKVRLKPDWVCEILSDNKSDDFVKKMKWLHHFGVQFYWVVDTKRKVILVYEWSKEGYVNKTNAFKNQQLVLEPFVDIVFKINFLFDTD